MKLTDNEKRDIIKSIEEGKDLPERFRYLLFQNAQKVEINWEDKTSEVTNVCLPFQTIEHIDEPREEKEVKAQQSLDFAKGRKLQGWTNKLIWGDNKFVVSSILKGPMRNIIEENGGVKLIYIDPPFSVGMNYTIPVSIGSDGSKYDKKPTIIENFAYRNMWGKEGNSFLQMLFERISLMRNMLRDDGVLVMRIDHHWGHYAKAMLDEVFGKEHFRNEIFINRTKKNVIVSEEYPNKPPVVRFVSKMFHPNVYADGSICLDILQNRWSPTYDVSSILVIHFFQNFFFITFGFFWN